MIATDQIVQIRKDAPSGTIALNRPACRNAISREVVRQLLQGLEDLYQEKSVRAVILTGKGNVFSSGTDLFELNESRSESNTMDQWYADATSFQELIETMLRYPKPIICAVNGSVFGSATALLLASDLIVASGAATLALPEGRRGLVAGIAAPLLVHRIGASQAAKLLVTGQSIEAVEAHRIGLFHEVVDDSQVWVRANEMCAAIAESAPESVLLTKQLLNETVGEQLFTQLSIGAANMATARTTEAAEKGVTAFLEKRLPKWD